MLKNSLLSRGSRKHANALVCTQPLSIEFLRRLCSISFRKEIRLKRGRLFPPLFLKMSAIFNFQSLLTVVLLLICTCAYIRSIAPSFLDKNKEGLLGIFWKCARIGERKSPYVAFCCFAMAFSILFLS